MAEKKTTKKKAEPKEPEPTLVEGFTTKDYDGYELFICDRCGADTFSTEVAASHRQEHERSDAAMGEREELTEHLAERAQVEVADEQS